MGMTLDVRFPDARIPSWEGILVALQSRGEHPLLRMIDGLPAFPDEKPEEGWHELRVSVGGSMITLRRSPQGLSCVGWGNLDESGTRAWNLLAWACAIAGEGHIHTSSGDFTAEEFEVSAHLRPA